VVEPWASVGRVSTALAEDLVLALVDRLVDDAAVFPPARLTLTEAVRAHRVHRRAWYTDLVGPLLVRASQAADLVDVLRPGDDLSVGLVADTGLVGLAEGVRALLDLEDRAHLVQVEVALPPTHDPALAARAMLDELAFSAQAYVEVPLRNGWEGALDVLAEDGAERAKLRTGGTDAAAHPSDGQVAAFLRACLDRGLPVKLTAGLHQPLRTTSAQGFEQQGFLNVLAAVATGLSGADTVGLTRILGERRPEPVLEVLAGADPRPVRAAFVSFGCCGVTDPVDGLVGLGLLRPEVA